MGAGNDATRLLRELPSVHELAARLEAPRTLAVSAARRAIDEQRAALLDGGSFGEIDLAVRARELLDQLDQRSLRPVINGTGVIVHTNLGRAPLPAAAQDAVASVAAGYANLELDLATGERGSRHTHVEALLCELTGAEAAIVVNNGAAAVLLAVAALAAGGRSVIVSRGQLVEIGGGFRIPDVVAQSGARLVEVGTTNRTRLRDYQRAIGSGDAVGAILRVHQSNFRTLGFVEQVPIEALCGLGIPVIDDVGSGVLADLDALIDEPSIKRSTVAGSALVCCSGDKLLGGPQAGILVGESEAIACARRHPLARAFRIDKLSLAALEATLSLYRDPERARAEIPVLSMLELSEEQLTGRAGRLRELIGDELADIVRAVARVGGGALPLLELEGPVVALRGSAPAAEIARALRQGQPPVIGRIHDGRVLLDPRTMDEDELGPAAAAARAALQPGP